MNSVTRQEDSDRRFHDITVVLWVVMLLNLFVAVAKFAYGSLTSSVSMRADGIASMFDTASNLIGIVGLSMAARPADTEHPYGHAKFETYASAVIGVMLLLAAYNVVADALPALFGGKHEVEVNAGSFIVMVVTLIINLFVSRYERGRGAQLHSEILVADAMHTMSDALVSISVIVGLGFILAGFPLADPICSLVVAVAILHSAWEVFRQASATLSDRARIPTAEVAAKAGEVEGVRSCHHIRTRGTEGEVYMDLHVLVDPKMSILRAHALCTRVEKHLCSSYPQVVDVTVHMEPDIAEERREE